MTPSFLPAWVRDHWFEHEKRTENPDVRYQYLADRLARFSCETPEVSIVIPAWNEEETLLKTLSSLSALETGIPTELLVVNNRSTDRTQEILDRCRVRSVWEPRQGIPYARQTGLERARGRIILCGDADSVYPPEWVDRMVSELSNTSVAVVYSRYSFVPPPGRPRWIFSLYEGVVDLWYRFRSRNRPHLNAMGGSLGFRRKDAIDVGGFDLSMKRGSDGQLAWKLGRKGEIKGLYDRKTRIWSHTRRLYEQGSLLRALQRRFKKETSRIVEYSKRKHSPPSHQEIPK